MFIYILIFSYSISFRLNEHHGLSVVPERQSELMSTKPACVCVPCSMCESPEWFSIMEANCRLWQGRDETVRRQLANNGFL